MCAHNHSRNKPVNRHRLKSSRTGSFLRCAWFMNWLSAFLPLSSRATSYMATSEMFCRGDNGWNLNDGDKFLPTVQRHFSKPWFLSTKQKEGRRSSPPTAQNVQLSCVFCFHLGQEPSFGPLGMLYCKAQQKLST